MNIAIIVAGGKGLRMGTDLPKQFLPIGGRPVLMHTLQAFERAIPDIHLILVLPADQQDFWRSLCVRHTFTLPHTIATGGETRFHSVLNGLKTIGITMPSVLPKEQRHMNAIMPSASSAFPKEQRLFDSTVSSTFAEDMQSSSLVAIHDGVRPFVSADVIRRCFETARTTGAAVPVVPVVETIRELSADFKDIGDSIITDTASVTRDRSRYRLVQTPQTFQLSLLLRAYQQPYQSTFTDDASVVEALGHPITLVDGNRENIKITTPFDLTVAEAFLSQPAVS